ncbi:ABC transporter permease [Paenibacillus sp. IB182496]|uniref:ABC transporter permease n=1 Tax=Paenibacillus sabuli TaxID=2772509 RepID=A0A927GQH0_9BACL|nr:ABC transporter permease [Paenibacillus sabuli]MBD2844276.1 ABC transporter permease [Paenibacillus sabuli]
MKAYVQLTLAQLRLFARNRQVLFWTLFFPVFFMILLGSFLGGDNAITLEGLVVNEDRSAGASELERQLLANPVLLSELADDRDSALQQLQDGDTQYVVVLPAGLGDAIEAGAGEAVVRLYTDDTNRTVSEVVTAAVSAQVDQISKSRTGYEPIVTVEAEGVQALNLRYIDFLVPGIVAMMIMSNNLNGVAGQIASWRERGILRRMQSTPLHAASFIGAQITARLLLNGLQAVIVVLIGQLAFGTQVNGSWLLLLGLIVMGTLAFMSIGFIIAGLAKTPESAGPIAGFVSFPLLFLGGVFFPIANMPDFLQPIVELLPISHLATGMRQVMNVGASLGDIWYDAALLGGWLIAAFVIASFTFKWE